MRYKKKLIILVILFLLLTLIQYTFPYSPQLVHLYNAFIFVPVQTARNLVLGYVPLSIGDLLYLFAGVLLLITIGEWVYYLATIKKHKHELAHSFLQFIIILCSAYIWFFAGWGGNYYKQRLVSYWNLDKTGWSDTTTLVDFDKYLITKLNGYAPYYHSVTLKEVNHLSKGYYRNNTNAATRKVGLNVKPSVFGRYMEYLGIQGYYNPFTGEAQINKHLPPFMLPFVVCHEMAHQAGIAAEDDANLLSFALGMQVPDTVFNYSAYFNLWLYTQGRLMRIDSVKGNNLKATLNPLSISHLDTLKAIREQYRGAFSEYSMALYDSYLKLHNQKEGVRSYSNAIISAWALDKKLRAQKERVINIP